MGITEPREKRSVNQIQMDKLAAMPIKDLSQFVKKQTEWTFIHSRTSEMNRFIGLFAVPYLEFGEFVIPGIDAISGLANQCGYS
jgi:hypothetical protein